MNTTKKPRRWSETKSVWGVCNGDHMTITWCQEKKRLELGLGKYSNRL